MHQVCMSRVIFKAVCQSTLLYGCSSLNFSRSDCDKLERYQGKLVKRMLCLPERCHHKNLVTGLGISPVSDVLTERLLSLYHRVFLTKSLMFNLCSYVLQQFLRCGLTVKGTILDRLRTKILDFNPITAIFKRIKYHVPRLNNGIVDSIEFLANNSPVFNSWH